MHFLICCLVYFFLLEPDIGMPQMLAQKYFRQLLDGVVCKPQYFRSTVLWLKIFIHYFLYIYVGAKLYKKHMYLTFILNVITYHNFIYLFEIIQEF
jgi:hypothetical protein